MELENQNGTAFPLSIGLQIWTAFVCAPHGGVLLEQNRGEPPRSPSIISRPYFQTDLIAGAIIFDGNELLAIVF